MKKLSEIFCAFLAAILCFSLPSCNTDDGSLRIGVYGLTGDTSPFSRTGGADGAVKDMLYSRLVSSSPDGSAVWGDGENCVALNVEFYSSDETFEKTDGGSFTAVEITLKNSMLFSDSTSLSANDVVFSIYAACDAEIGYLDFASFPLVGLYDYKVGKTGAEKIANSAKEAVQNGFVTDVFTEEEIAQLKNCIVTSGEEFANGIVTYAADNYLNDESAEIYVSNGVTADDIENSKGMSTAFAMTLWNYGTFVYEYEADPDGNLVGIRNENGGYTYKTTLKNALENEMYVTYVPDDDGDYAYDFSSESYYLDTEKESYIHYSKVLSDKYTVISKSALTGFKDTEGKLYSITDGDFPSAADFFEIMSRSYSSNGTVDYEALEGNESASEADRFFEKALENFAVGICDGKQPEEISGIKVGNVEIDGETFDSLTLLFDGVFDNTSKLCDIFIVSAKNYLSDFQTDKTLNAAGFPSGDADFAAHVKEIGENPVGSGPYVLQSKGKGEISLVANQMFFSMGKSLHVSYTKTVTIKDITSSGASKSISGGTVNAVISENDFESVTKLEKKNNVETFFIPDESYYYVVVNPSYYLNIRTRTAILSLLDTSIARQNSKGSEISYSIPTFYGFENGETQDLYDPTLTVAWDNFAMSGYTANTDGIMINTKTGEQAEFTFCLMPGEENGAMYPMFEKACEHLEELGAKAEIVFDGDLLYNIYSDNGVAIYALSWDLRDAGDALAERYSVTKSKDNVKANGVKALYDGGQIDNYGTVTFGSETLNQSDAVEKLDSLIASSDNTLDAVEKRQFRADALELIQTLRFELPTYQNGSYALIRSDYIDTSTLNRSPSISSSVFSRIWDVKLISYEEQSSESSQDTADVSSQNENEST